MLFNGIINTTICNKISTLPGLEPGMPLFVVRCLRMCDMLCIEIIHTTICNKILTLPGLEPEIPWCIVRCLIHFATGPSASFKSSRISVILFNEIINTTICNKISTLPGLEPGIPWFVVRCLSHWATGTIVVAGQGAGGTGCSLRCSMQQYATKYRPYQDWNLEYPDS